MAMIDPTELLARLPVRPGVYRMLDTRGQILYVGKARNLKSRVASYFRDDLADPKTRALVQRIAEVSVTVTHTEAEALLLESNLIKAHRPRYNVVLRDDKSYPYIRLADTHSYPRMEFYRGPRRRDARYFGPFPNAYAVRAALKEMQRLFLIRECSDSFFANRARPCLQHQIGRCSAPCVGLIEPAEYAEDIAGAVQFLQGRDGRVIDGLVARMERAAAAQQYERAAALRDRIARLRRVQAHQSMAGGRIDADVIALASHGGQWCVGVASVRRGRHLGHRTFFPTAPPDADAPLVRLQFLGQYYVDREPPREIVLDGPVAEDALLAQALGESAGRRVRLRLRVRADRAQWLALLQQDVRRVLGDRIASEAGIRERLIALQTLLALPTPPERVECFDVSHTMGEATVASCVVFGPQGALKADYRRFNIRAVAAGDDYAAMRQALMRRYSRRQREGAALPDVLLIDGGRGQLRQAEAVLAELGLEHIALVAVAKGPSRRPGAEQLLRPGCQAPLQLQGNAPALHLVQQIRDEAHRFAITGHRQRRAKARQRSVLEDIPGLGPKRRQQLLKQFGGLQQLQRAGVRDLASVPGISERLAARIYAHFHPES
ncbi:MAG: excinuclease ABC subunit UvrC [Pseudomonadota bacterium]|nr:excinuclease ABC subunit UvrC [Pseudomonadota bacterium]